jgi:hypothetical protein
MPKKLTSYQSSLKSQKVTNSLLTSNNPKKDLKNEGLSNKDVNKQYKKHIKSLK